MRIIECNIKSFGALSNMRIELDRGLNCFVGDNGVGKSTVAAFIKAMLYGLGETRKSSIEENDRKHYLPWSGGTAGGTMTFTAGGKHYRVERSFGKRPSDDTFALYDTRLGKESNDFGPNIGEAIFGIDADGFERTAYFSERNLVPEADVSSSGAAAEDGVAAELSGGALNVALEILDEQRKYYQKKGGGGAIADTKKEIIGIDGRLEELRGVKARALEAEARIASLSRDKAEMTSKAREIADRKAKLQAREGLKKADERKKDIRRELSVLTPKKDGIIEFFGGAVPTRDQLSDLEYDSKRAKELRQRARVMDERDAERGELEKEFRGKLTDADAEAARQAVITLEAVSDDRGEKIDRTFKNRIPTHGELDALISDYTAKNKAPLLISTIIGAVLCAAGAALGVLVMPLCFAICALGVLTMAAGIIIGVAKGSKASARAKENAKALIESIGALDIKSPVELSALIEIRGLIDEATVRHNRHTAAEGILSELCAKFSTRGGDIVEKTKNILTDYNRLKSLSGSALGDDELSPGVIAGKLFDKVAEALSAYKVTSDDPIFEAKAKRDEYESITARIVSLTEELERLCAMSGLDTEAVSDDTAEGLESEAARVRSSLTDIDGELAILNRQYDSDIKELEETERLLIDKDKAKLTLEQYESELRAIQGASTYLKRAADLMNEKYLAGALASFKEYSSALGLSDGSFEMKTDYSTSVVDSTGTHTTESYSRGSRDGYRLAARLAILDSLYSGETAFLLLDDPFLSFDDDRAKSALSLIERIAEDRQVIYMTCSESRATSEKKRFG